MKNKVSKKGSYLWSAKALQLFLTILLSYGMVQSQNPYQGSPQRSSSYDDNLPWLNQAKDRINTHRKANLTVRVVDLNGVSVPNAIVKVRMKKHAFPFGSAVSASQLINNATYRQIVKENYNRTVLENDLKWNFWSPSNPDIRDRNRATAIRALDSMISYGQSTRGHVLVWPRFDHAPAWLETQYNEQRATNGDAAARIWLRDKIREHVIEHAGHPDLKGKLTDWDVQNEPYTNHQYMDIIDDPATPSVHEGEDEMVEWFKLARQADPNAKRYINDFNILNDRDPIHANHYFNTISTLLAKGAPLQGIGFQSHMGRTLPEPTRIMEIIDRFAALSPNLELQSTELDINIKDIDKEGPLTPAEETLQADFLRDFMTVLFSHPRINGIVMWGFWEGRHWKPNAALYRTNWEIKPNGVQWKDLVFSRWWTDTTGTSSSNGQYAVRGFMGDYEIEAERGSETKVLQTTLPKDGKTITIALDFVFPPSNPTNLVASVTAPNKITLNWTSGSTNQSGFKIERSEVNSASGFAQVGTVGANVTTFTDAGLANNKRYYYRVRAYNDGGNSAYSGWVNALTLQPTSVFDPLTNWTKTSSHTSGFNFGTSNTQRYHGDASRVVRTSVSTQSFVYNYNNISNFNVKVYYHVTLDATITFCTSPNGTTWTSIAATGSAPTASADNWFFKRFTPSGAVPAGTNYLRIQISGGSDHWDPQISEVTINYYLLGDAAARMAAQPRETNAKIEEGSLLYPNPASEAIRLQLNTLQTESVTLVMQNSLGRQVLRTQKEVQRGQIITLPVHSLPNGLYLLSIYRKEGVITKKVVIKK